MLTLHHLNDSRSQRILWLLEELGAPYEIKHYQRDATTRLAPPELVAVHPLGKSPVITDGEVDIARVRRRSSTTSSASTGAASWRREPAHENFYNEWLHYAEGSAMLPLMLNMYVGRLGEAGAPLQPRIESEMANHLGYVERHAGRPRLADGQSLTAADIQMSFVGDMAKVFDRLGPYPHLGAWLSRMHARPWRFSARSKRAARTGLRGEADLASPSPLWGPKLALEVGEGATGAVLGDPTPDPSPQGGGGV